MEILAVTILTAFIFLGLSVHKRNHKYAPAVEIVAGITFTIGSILILISLLMRLL